jgi:hypothetical protein
VVSSGQQPYMQRQNSRCRKKEKVAFKNKLKQLDTHAKEKRLSQSASFIPVVQGKSNGSYLIRIATPRVNCIKVP